MVINKILVYILGILLLCSIVYGTIEHFQIDSLRGKITTLDKDKINLEQEVSNCKANVLDLNQKVTDAKNKSDGFKSQMDDLQKKFDQEKEQNKQLVDALKKQPAPKTCDEAKEYLKKNLELFQ